MKNEWLQRKAEREMSGLTFSSNIITSVTRTIAADGPSPICSVGTIWAGDTEEELEALRTLLYHEMAHTDLLEQPLTFVIEDVKQMISEE